MISEFKFTIDKEAIFFYWAQLMVGKWSWYFEPENYELFKKNSGEFSDSENEALDKFKSIIQKKENQYLWLWQRYNNQPISNQEEIETFGSVRKILDSKFENVWQGELPKLESWKSRLESHDFAKYHNIFKKIIGFLNSNQIKGQIQV